MTNGFVGELMIFTSLYRLDVLQLLIAGSGIILGAVYMLTSYQKIMLGPDTDTTLTDITNSDKTLLYCIACIVIITGLY
ncbi:MAG: NADH-quinone oxidoreductase subunit M, partial [Saprospiraceae bacterium]|nr:NADH-quinone oxidoreductase subunit M [Saprospiraceae bacterium]